MSSFNRLPGFCMRDQKRLGVTHSANLCTICTSLKSTDLALFFRRWLYGSIIIHFYRASSRKAIYMVIQDDRSWYQSKVQMRLPICLTLTICLSSMNVKLKLFHNRFLNFHNRLLTDDRIDSRQSWAGPNLRFKLPSPWRVRSTSL